MKTENKNNKQLIDSQSFNAQSHKRGKLTKDIIIAFAVIVVLVAAVSVFVMLKENDFKFKNVISSINPNAEATTELTTEAADLSGKINILLASTDSTTQKLRFSVILNVDLNNLTLKVCPIALNTAADTQTYSGNMAQHYTYGGMPQLALAVESVTGISIERYVKSDEKTFLDILKLFDVLSVEVPAAVTYTMNGISYSLNSGKQAMTPDIAQKYMMYVSENGYSYDLPLFISGLINTCLTAENAADSEYYFKKLSNAFETDISAMDYAKYSGKLVAFITDENRQPAVPVDTVEGF